MAEKEKPKGLAYQSLSDVAFGRCRQPVICGYNVAIGAGEVLPEVNFTLPTMSLSEETFSEVRNRYREMVQRILTRAVQLNQESLVLELEHLYEMTQNPHWGALLTKDIKEVMDQFHQQYGLKTALRVTVADIREQQRPPRMRTGENLERVLESFRLCSEAGADILSIESTGGKEVSDRALTEGNLAGLVYAVGILAPADMTFLWSQIVSIADRYGIVPGGDTACGFANTAMQLAHQGLIPKVLAAVMRLACVPRSLTAVRQGARGPLKDCGYENPVIKILTGVPISMEGKSSACAHSSPLGNIAAVACDLWSNESVQDVRLLGGYAPEVFTEILIYDCRLMNEALQRGFASELQSLLASSDRYRDPQALMLDPEVLWQCAQIIHQVGDDPFQQTLSLVRFSLTILRQAYQEKNIKLSDREQRWLSSLEAVASEIPDDADQLRQMVDGDYSYLYLPEEYGLPKG